MSVIVWAERYLALDWEPRPQLSYGLLPVEVDVLRGTKVAGEGDAVEELAGLAFEDRGAVKEREEEDEEAGDEDEREPDEEDLAPLVVLPEGDEGHEGVRREEAEDEAEEVGVVVDPGQDADEQEDAQDADELHEGAPGVLEHGPAVEDLDDEGGEEGEVSAGWAHL